MEPFELESMAHQLVEIGIQLVFVAHKIAEQVGTPTGEELDQTAQRTIREARKILDDPEFHFAEHRALPWP